MDRERLDIVDALTSVGYLIKELVDFKHRENPAKGHYGGWYLLVPDLNTTELSPLIMKLEEMDYRIVTIDYNCNYDSEGVHIFFAKKYCF